MVSVCEICNRPRESPAKGSITQWVFVCRCSLSRENSGEASPSVICNQCGKKKRTSREGSLTQWVFRSDTCKCDPDSDKSLKIGLPEQEERIKASEPLVCLELSEKDFPVDRYQPVRWLDYGAHGEVCLARDTLLGKSVAIKKLHSLSSRAIIQFQNEARLVSKLNHPGIVQILDFGITENQDPYMVMELIDGISLRKWIDENGAFVVSDACQIVIEILNALVYAHEAGVLHRDLTPNNVMLSINREEIPEIKIIDFGIAKIREPLGEEEDGNVTLAGSPLYMSADQANGIAYDERSEIYSIGILFFELVCGVVPFKGETPLETISLHAHNSPPYISEINQTVQIDAQLEQIIRKCLEKNPDERYQNASQLKEAILEFLDSERNVSNEGACLEESGSNAVSGGKISHFLWIAVSGSFLVLTFAAINFSRPNDPPAAITSLKSQNRESTILKELEEKSGTFLTGVGEGNLPYTFPVDFLMCNDERVKELENSKIKNLALWNCPISGTGLLYLKNVPLEGLNLDGSSIEVDNFKNLKQIKTLESIHLGRTMIDAKALKSMGASSKYVKLTFDGCRAIDDQAVEVIVNQYPNLEYLSLSGTPVTSKSFKLLGKLKKLIILNVGRTSFSDSEVASIIHLPLDRLNLSNTGITNQGVKELLKIPTLTTIDLYNCPGVTRVFVRDTRRKRRGLRLIFQQPLNGELKELAPEF